MRHVDEARAAPPCRPAPAPTSPNAVRPLVVNQTEGFSQGQNQVFTHGQNFHCTVEPFDDLDGLVGGPDGTPAAADPAEMIDALGAAQQGGGAGRDIPTNLWLFFANQPLEGHAGH